MLFAFTFKLLVGWEQLLLDDELEKQLELDEAIDSGDEGGVMFEVVVCPAVNGDAGGIKLAASAVGAAECTGLRRATIFRAAAEVRLLPLEGITFFAWMVVDKLLSQLKAAAETGSRGGKFDGITTGAKAGKLLPKLSQPLGRTSCCCCC